MSFAPWYLAIVELLEQLDKLKAVHRASESPTFGQVEALFDQADVVRRLVQANDRPQRVAWPTANRATEQAARRLVELVMASLTEPGVGR